VSMDGRSTVLVDGLPTGGDHYTGEIAFGPDGKMYFGIGTATNSGVVGLDNFLNGWLGKYRNLRDIPTRDIVLLGTTFVSPDPFAFAPTKTAVTGAFAPFGTTPPAGQTIKGQVKGNGAVLRASADGSALEVFADGLRNPFGISFAPGGKLYATVEGFDDRGSRPIAGDYDALWVLDKGGWYGWPDFASGMPVTDKRFQPTGKPQPAFILRDHPKLSGKPEALLEPHSAAMKLDWSPGAQFGYKGQAFIAEFGDLTPVTGKLPAGESAAGAQPGYRVVRFDPQAKTVAEFLVNRKPGPSGAGPERPIAVRFSPDGQRLYVLDFGVMEVVPGQMIPRAGSGVLWAVKKGAGSKFPAKTTATRTRRSWFALPLALGGGPNAGARAVGWAVAAVAGLGVLGFIAYQLLHRRRV